MKISPIALRNLAALALFSLMTACSSQKTWVYRPNSYAPAKGAAKGTVAVMPFEDARENSNVNLSQLYLIPGFPFGWQNLKTPEGIQMHTNSGMWVNYKPTEDFAKALAEDLRYTGMFSDAFFDYRRSSGQYVVTGKIINTNYCGYLLSYCASIYGPDLWFVGFPATYTSNDLCLELSLSDGRTNKTLFSKVYNATPIGTVSWIYCMRNDFNYAEMLRQINKEFCEDIKDLH